MVPAPGAKGKKFSVFADTLLGIEETAKKILFSAPQDAKSLKDTSYLLEPMAE